MRRQKFEYKNRLAVVLLLMRMNAKFQIFAGKCLLTWRFAAVFEALFLTGEVVDVFFVKFSIFFRFLESLELPKN